MIYDLRGMAHRLNGAIGVYLIGNLPTPCYDAKVVDVYPGGRIKYVRDPGSAQIFLEVVSKPSPLCLDVLTPWSAHHSIADSHHEGVSVFVNSHLTITLPIIELEDPTIHQSNLTDTMFSAIEGTGAKKKKPDLKFKVIALVDGGKCSTIPSDSIFPQIYREVFGPASKSACDTWVAENCK